MSNNGIKGDGKKPPRLMPDDQLGIKNKMMEAMKPFLSQEGLGSGPLN